MRKLISAFLSRQVIGNFLTGLFVILPVVITAAIMGWVGGILRRWLGSESFVGKALALLGAQFVADPLALVAGWIIVLVGIWVLGAFVQAAGRERIEKAINQVFEQLPIVSSLYKPVTQVVDLLKKKDKDEIRGMQVVYCRFGEESGVGILGLLVSPHVYRFAGQQCHVVYLPTSPVPMSGGIMFVPKHQVELVDMSIDDLMQIYFSIGVMCPRTIPEKYHAG